METHDDWLLVTREGGTATIEAGDWVRLRNEREMGPVDWHGGRWVIPCGSDRWLTYEIDGLEACSRNTATDITHVRKGGRGG
jgi:hypothetical protein